MDRETLARILGRASGVEGEDSRFDVAEDHRLTFYIGEPGQAMQLGPIASCTLDDGFVELSTREDQAQVFVRYDMVQAVYARPARSKHGRAGFA